MHESQAQVRDLFNGFLSLQESPSTSRYGVEAGKLGDAVVLDLGCEFLDNRPRLDETAG